MTLGERIYKLRTEKEMSQEDLAVYHGLRYDPFHNLFQEDPTG